MGGIWKISIFGSISVNSPSAVSASLYCIVGYINTSTGFINQIATSNNVFMSEIENLTQYDMQVLLPTIIIPIKDNAELLTKTISNLIQFEIDRMCNIIIVDDRSKDNIKNIHGNQLIDNDIVNLEYSIDEGKTWQKFEIEDE